MRIFKNPPKVKAFVKDKDLQIHILVKSHDKALFVKQEFSQLKRKEFIKNK